MASFLPTAATAVTTTAAVWMSLAQTSLAADSPNWGVFEGRTGSLLHPIMMGSLLVFSINTALLGFQWRRQRTAGDIIKEKQQQLPKNLPAGAKTVAEALAAVKSAADAATATDTAAEPVDAALVAQLQAALPLEQEIQQLQQDRKELAAAGPRDRHFAQGALLACLGTLFAIEVSIYISMSISI